MDTGIYKITCKTNGKIYIGSAKWIRKRLSKHRWCLRNGRHTNPHLQNAFNLYGEEQFSFEVQEICDLSKLLEREQYWMDQLQTTDKNRGFNIVPYADRREMSKETKQRVSQALKGIPKTDAARENMRKAQQNRSDEWRQNMSNGQRGLKKSADAKKNMSNARNKLIASGYESPRKGQKATEETRRKISAAGKGRSPPNKGQSMTENQKQKVSHSLRKLYDSGYININSTACYCVETGKQFSSFAEAAKSIGVTPSAISVAIRLRNGRCKELTFRRMTNGTGD